MVAWSGLLRSTGQLFARGSRIFRKNPPQNGAMQIRLMSEERLMQITPTRWQWHKTKDLLHLYFMVGAIPCAITILLSQIFIGPGELTPMPEGYVPKHWEYHRDPISRFISRYIYTSPQMEYEKYLHYLWAETEMIKLRKLEDKVDRLMYANQDYQAYYYQPFDGKYVRRAHLDQHEKVEISRGS